MPAEPNPGAVGGLIALGLSGSSNGASDTLYIEGGLGVLDKGPEGTVSRYLSSL